MRGFETQLNVCFRIPKYRHDVYDVYDAQTSVSNQ